MLGGIGQVGDLAWRASGYAEPREMRGVRKTLMSESSVASFVLISHSYQVHRWGENIARKALGMGIYRQAKGAPWFGTFYYFPAGDRIFGFRYLR